MPKESNVWLERPNKTIFPKIFLSTKSLGGKRGEECAWVRVANAYFFLFLLF